MTDKQYKQVPVEPDSKSNELDWIQDIEVTNTMGRGWCVRISGTDIFSELNQHGCKGRMTFSIASELSDQKAGEKAAREWLKRQLRRFPDSEHPSPAESLEGGRESVDDALAVVESFGPGIVGVNDTIARQILLAVEVKRLRKVYEQAVKGRAEFRLALTVQRTAINAALEVAAGEIDRLNERAGDAASYDQREMDGVEIARMEALSAAADLVLGLRSQPAQRNEWTEQDVLLELIHLKFQSGNDILVERITLTREELNSAFPGWLK